MHGNDYNRLRIKKYACPVIPRNVSVKQFEICARCQDDTTR